MTGVGIGTAAGTLNLVYHPGVMATTGRMIHSVHHDAWGTVDQTEEPLVPARIGTRLGNAQLVGEEEVGAVND